MDVLVPDTDTNLLSPVPVHNLRKFYSWFWNHCVLWTARLPLDGVVL